jgi:acetolactate synthase-1/2/3 large subunit
MILSGAKAIIKSLEMENVDIIFGYPGAAICPFYDAVLDSSVTHILTRHEQGAAHAASGYARVTNKVGVCVSTSGPGATNLITGIATAYMDSIPMVIITGQVSSELIGRDVFQEADITGATAPFCKHSYLVSKAKDIPRIFREAFYIASTGRPGPVLIDIPIDIQKVEFDFEYPEKVEIAGYKPRIKGHGIQIQRIAQAIEKARAPLICCGGGTITANVSKELEELSTNCNIPIVSTLMGIGCVPSDYPLYLGMVGSHGVYPANYALNNADLIIIMGARVGDRAIKSASKLSEKSTIVHIDVDPAEIGKNIEVDIPVVGDLKYILIELNKVVKPGIAYGWKENVVQIRKEVKSSTCNKDNYVCPKILFAELSQVIDENTIVTTEVGQNQIWAANHVKVKAPRRFLTSGGLGTMGYGLPAAVGAKFGKPESRVIVISGDGSFQMSMQELGTMKQNDLDIKMIVFNNSRLGMVRELQKVNYERRYSQVFLENNPDFIKIFEAYGFSGERINSNSQVNGAIERMLAHKGAYILECIVDPEENTL